MSEFINHRGRKGCGVPVSSLAIKNHMTIQSQLAELLVAFARSYKGIDTKFQSTGNTEQVNPCLQIPLIANCLCCNMASVLPFKFGQVVPSTDPSYGEGVT